MFSSIKNVKYEVQREIDINLQVFFQNLNMWSNPVSTWFVHTSKVNQNKSYSRLKLNQTRSTYQGGFISVSALFRISFALCKQKSGLDSDQFCCCNPNVYVLYTWLLIMAARKSTSSDIDTKINYWKIIWSISYSLPRLPGAYFQQICAQNVYARQRTLRWGLCLWGSIRLDRDWLDYF